MTSTISPFCHPYGLKKSLLYQPGSIFAPCVARCSVQKTPASAEPAAKNLSPTDHDQQKIEFRCHRCQFAWKMQVAGPKFHICYALTRLFESYVFKIVLPACFLWIRIRVSIKTTSLHEKCKLQKCPSHDGNAIIQCSTHYLQKQQSCMHVLMISSPYSRRFRFACFLSPICCCMPSMNWRAAVCPPQRAFNKFDTLEQI